MNSKTKNIKKGTIIQNQDAKVKRSYTVVKGLLKSYTIDEKGKEHIFMFAPEGWIIGDLESQVFDLPSQLDIEAIEDAEIVIHDDLDLRFDSMDINEAKKSLHLLSRRVGVLQKRVILLMSASAQVRYEHFLETYPDLLNRIPQWMIASYLGITPEALSKIRGNMSRNRS